MKLALIENIKELGSSWDWNENTFRAVQSDQTDAQRLDLPGFSPDIDFTLTFVRADFGDYLPGIGQKVINTKSRSEYRIEKVTYSEADPGLVIHCLSVDQSR